MYKEMLEWWAGIFIAVEIVCLLAYLINKERTTPSSKEEEEKFYRTCEKFIGKKATEIVREFI